MRLAHDGRSRDVAMAGKQRETTLLARDDRSKCDSGSGNRRPLGCEGAPRVAVGEEALAVGSKVMGSGS
ncbi:hypothetical protein BHE74_00041262 [Ensete ventricosum]|nr:hypothetical protein BHE74_00041262 [Ensete ventricosum]